MTHDELQNSVVHRANQIAAHCSTCPSRFDDTVNQRGSYGVHGEKRQRLANGAPCTLYTWCPIIVAQKYETNGGGVMGGGGDNIYRYRILHTYINTNSIRFVVPPLLIRAKTICFYC